MSGATPGDIGPDRLADTRVQLHHAIQPLTSFAQALAEPLDDDRHRNFDWDIGIRGFRTRPASDASGVTAAFAVESFEFRVEREDVVLASIPGVGRTVGELRTALEAAARDALPAGSEVSGFVPPEFDLPGHRVAGGDAPLEPDMDVLRELARWYTHADRALLRLQERVDVRVDPARVWPHHFDLATLLHAAAGTVGVGLSPGDRGIPNPYWYVRGYPNDDTGHDPAGLDLPDLAAGRWKSEGWTGAVLEVPDLAAGTTSSGERDRVTDAFLDTTVSFCLGLLD